MSQLSPPSYHSQPSDLYPVQPGSVLQSWHDATAILMQPAVVVESVTETFHSKRFTIYDVSGNIIGYMEREVRSIFTSPLKPGRSFVVKVVDPYGKLLLTIRRPHPLLHTRIEVSVPDPRTGQDLLIGGSQDMFHLFKRRFDLYNGEYVKVHRGNWTGQTVGSIIHRTDIGQITRSLSTLANTRDRDNPFGKISAGSMSDFLPVENRASEVVASIDRQWQGMMHELFSRNNLYVVRMDPWTFDPAEYPYVGDPLSLDQRAILLGTAVAVDIDFFTPKGNHGAAGMGAGGAGGFGAI